MKIAYIILLTLILISCFSSVYAVDVAEKWHKFRSNEPVTDEEAANGIMGVIGMIIFILMIANIFKDYPIVALAFFVIGIIIFVVYF